MAAKLNTTKSIPLNRGSQATGPTMPGPGSPWGGGKGATGPSGKSQNTGGGGFGRATGINKGGKGMKGC